MEKQQQPQEQQSMSFTREDVKRAAIFGQFITEKASWNLDTKGTLELTKHLAWYNSAVQKMNANIMELTGVVHPPKKEGDKK